MLSPVFHTKPAILQAIENLSLDWLHERVIDRDGCLVWTRSAAHGADPQATLGGKNGGVILVRRVLWELANERPFPRNRIARCSCGTDLCVHPDHVQPIAKTQLLRGRAIPLRHRVNIAAAKRAKSGLSDAAVAYIRSTDGPLEEMADLFSIDPTYVSHIRLGKVRIDYSTPFTGLGKRSGAAGA